MFVFSQNDDVSDLLPLDAPLVVLINLVKGVLGNVEKQLSVCIIFQLVEGSNLLFDVSDSLAAMELPQELDLV